MRDGTHVCKRQRGWGERPGGGVTLFGARLTPPEKARAEQMTPVFLSLSLSCLLMWRHVLRRGRGNIKFVSCEDGGWSESPPVAKFGGCGRSSGEGREGASWMCDALSRGGIGDERVMSQQAARPVAWPRWRYQSSRAAS